VAEGVIGYRIIGLIGAGGFGKVYRARQESSEGFAKDVAIKILHDDEPRKALLARFRDEARILGLIRDRAIVGVEPPVKLADRWAVVMEWVDGTSLRDLIDEYGRIPVCVALEVVEEVARALDNAFHQQVEGEALQLLHRDIKPDNIQVTPSGETRLLDFGIAKANFAGRETKTRKAFGGTPGYIAPERPEGIEQPAGDVYSLGVVLYEAVVGERSRGAVDIDDDDLPRIDTEELDLPDDVTPAMRRALELSARMRNADYTARPTAREVEEASRTLRAEIGEELLRDWARENVSNRPEMEPDERVGVVYDVTSGTPPPATRRDFASLPPVTGQEGGARIAMGGLMAGGLGLGIGLGLTGLGVVAVALAALFVSQAPSTVPTTDEPDLPVMPATPDDPPEPDTPAPVEPAPAPVEPTPAPAAPAPVAPKPTPRPKPTERVITLPGATPPAPSPGSDPADATPQPGRAAGTLVVRTVPSGAQVKRAGQVLKGTGNRYQLPVGSHSLLLVSPSGEEARLPVNIRKGSVTEICYSFDTNRSCAP